jgi:hypothetical protein
VLQAAPALAWEKPVWQVHAPVPVMPWSQIPPMPHAHGSHCAPYRPAAHCAQAVPLAYVPLGQDDTHVAVAGARSSGGVQLRQLVALAVQVAQLVLQAVHTLLGPM